MSGGVEFSAGAVFPYTIEGLAAGQYAVLAVSDADGNGSFEDSGDFIGGYPDVTGAQPVTPPATGIDFTMALASTLGATSATPTVKLSDEVIAQLLNK